MKSIPKIIALLLLAAHALQAQTEEADSSNLGIQMAAYWQAGDEYDFEVTRTRQTYKNELLTKSDSVTFEAKLTVMQVWPTKYKLMWEYKFDPGHLLQNSFSGKVEAFQNLSQIKVLYETDADGAFDQITNIEEISEAMTAAIDAMVKSIDPKKLNKEDKKRLSQFTNYMTSAEMINEMAFRELHLLHWPFGAEFHPTDTFYYEDELPNLFGGDPVPAEGAFYVHEIDEEEGYIAIMNHVWPDPEALINMLRDFFTKMSMAKEELATLMASAEMNIEDSRYMAYSYATGIPMYLTYLREIEVKITGEEAYSTDKINLKLIKYTNPEGETYE